ncbi:sialic acid-binding Ig-like lectin 12 [Conger conger]|uniref:sialic acid-binding Ig-like lectin 12 n=1 Tax=Conger conger TaxID=82655 RepID=UPI002A5A7C18|nr:sialic acid-binding Ig-like lectin 12 [Conger conger]
MLKDQDMQSPRPGLLLLCVAWLAGASVDAQPSSIEILNRMSPLVSGHKATLDCKVSGFYPGNPSVLWFCRETPVLPGSITNSISRNNEGTFSLHSQYSFSPEVKDHNAVCVCQASHPAWRHTHRTSTTLTVHYGPEAVTVSTDSAVVANGSVLVTNGFTLNLICVADGNPRPETRWLGGSIKGVRHTETLHIPAVQREDEGLYWCVAQNPYGQQNTSITLWVSDSSPAHPDGNTALCGLVLIPLAWVWAIVIIYLLKRGGSKTSALTDQTTVVYTVQKTQEVMRPTTQRTE